MEITERQFERILTATIILEDRNSVPRAVNLIREVLDELEEKENDLFPEFKLADQGKGERKDFVREYGHLLLSGGTVLPVLLHKVMSYFGMDVTETAELLGLPENSVEEYLKNGLNEPVIRQAAEKFFGTCE